MKHLNQMMQQFQGIQAKMTDMQNKLMDDRIEGQSGGGSVKVTLNGKAEMQAIKIDPALLVAEDVDVLEDLILAAYNDGKNQVEVHVADKMKSITGGLALPPGFKMPF